MTKSRYMRKEGKDRDDTRRICWQKQNVVFKIRTYNRCNNTVQFDLKTVKCDSMMVHAKEFYLQILSWASNRVYVEYLEFLAKQPTHKCKLSMLRCCTQPQSWKKCKAQIIIPQDCSKSFLYSSWPDLAYYFLKSKVNTILLRLAGGQSPRYPNQSWYYDLQIYKSV